MDIKRLIIGLFWIGLLLRPLSAQITIPDFQAVDGPWECVDSTGIHGIFLSASARLIGSGGQQKVAWQTETIFVSRRLKAGGSQGGYFNPNHADATSMVSFDGKRLIMQFTNSKLPNLSPFDMDISYDHGARRWVGSWSFCNATGEAVLERPHPPQDVLANVLVGNWEGGPNFALGSGLLEVRESMDGTLLAWLNASTSSNVRSQIGDEQRETDETLGRQFLVKSSSANRVIFGIAEGVWFEGTVSSDGTDINGVWNNEGNGIAPAEGKRPTIVAAYRRKN